MVAGDLTAVVAQGPPAEAIGALDAVAPESRGRRLEYAAQTRLQVPVGEGEPARFEGCGPHPGASEQQGVGQLRSEQKPRAEPGHREPGGAGQHPAQDSREFAVSDGFRRSQVYRSAHVALQQPRNRPDLVVESDPAPPLGPRSKPPAQTELEQRQQLGQRTSLLAQDDAGASADHPDSGRGCGGRFGLPAYAERRQEVVTRGALLGKDLVATVTIDPDCRRAHKHPRLAIQTSQSASEQRSRAGAAIDENPFAGVTPAAIPDACACEIDHRVNTFEATGIDRAGLGIPAKGKLTRSNRAAHNPKDMVAGPGEMGTQC